MHLNYLRQQLALWGRLCRAVGPGYPTMSTTERARIGRGGVFDGPYLPDDLAELDHEVARSPAPYRLILVEHYTKDGGWREHIARLRMAGIVLSVDAYYRRKKTAEVYLNTRLRGANERLILRAS